MINYFKKTIIAIFAFVCFVGTVGFNPSIAAVHSGKMMPFTVVFKEEQLPNNVSDIIEKLGGTIVESIPEIGVIQVKAPDNFASEAIKNSSISAANPSMEMTLPEAKKINMDDSTMDTNEESLSDLQWDIKRVTNDRKSYDISTGDHSIVVGIIDSGIDVHHPDLQQNLLPGSKNFVPAGGGPQALMNLKQGISMTFKIVTVMEHTWLEQLLETVIY